jgi:uncharacterized membrane protein HdeD (DUF308 family)
MGTASVTAPTLVKKGLNWSLALSVAMIVAGFLAIVIPPVAGIAVTIFVGWMLLFSGIAHFVYAWHTRGAGMIIWEALVGIAYVLVGGYLLFRPLQGLASLTLAIAIYLFAEAFLEFVMAIQHRPRAGTGWLVLDGVITLILAVLIVRTWPSSVDWVLGTLVGISMLFSGFTRLAITNAAKRVLAQAA